MDKEYLEQYEGRCITIGIPNKNFQNSLFFHTGYVKDFTDKHFTIETTEGRKIVLLYELVLYLELTPVGKDSKKHVHFLEDNNEQE